MNPEWKVVAVQKVMPGIHEQVCVSIKTSVASHHSAPRMKFMLTLLVLAMNQTVKDGVVALQDGLHGSQAASVPRDIQD